MNNGLRSENTKKHEINRIKLKITFFVLAIKWSKDKYREWFN